MIPILILGFIGLLPLLNGCSSYPETKAGPAAETTRKTLSAPRPEAIQPAILENETRKSLSSLLSSPGVQRYIRKLHKISGTERRPLVQIGSIKNRTNDPAFRMDVIEETLFRGLAASGVFELTIATGTAGRLTPHARKMIQNPGEKRSLQRPDLTMDGYVASVITGIEPNQRKGIFLSLKLIDLQTGTVIWSFDRAIPQESHPIGINR